MPGKILYIEDNAMNMRLVKVILRPTDYEFLSADSGLRGIEKAQQEHRGENNNGPKKYIIINKK